MSGGCGGRGGGLCLRLVLVMPALKGIVLGPEGEIGLRTKMRGGGGLGGGGGRDFLFSAVGSFAITGSEFPVTSCCVLRKTGLIKDKALLEQLFSPSEVSGQVLVSSFPNGVQV